MATPRMRGESDELLSSPDPLNDTVSSALYPSSRRVTRSQRSQRLFSLGGSSTSPRKQMFELEVGDDRAPKRLLVTVEAEGDYENVGRRLFNSDTPTLRRGATTTTVPLGGDMRATAIKTPARRGRPPKSATGTPRTGTATRKRAAASPRKTPRQTRKAKISEFDRLEAELPTRGTPKSTARKRRATSQQSRGASDDPAPSPRLSITRGRGRPKRVEFSDQTVVDTIEEDANLDVPPSDDGLAASMADMVVDGRTPIQDQPAETLPESEPDIWMQTLDDEATPRANVQDSSLNRSPIPAHLQNKSPTPSEQLHSEAGFEQEYNDFDYAPGAPSDVSSLVGDSAGSGEPRDQDTVAQGEDFSMILANSIPSLRGNLSMRESALEDVGEETSLIINQTLESLRRSGALRLDDEDEVDLVDLDTVSVEQEAPVQERSQPTPKVEDHTHMLSIVDVATEVNESSMALPSLPRPDLPPPSPAEKQTSPGRLQSPAWARSSPRRKSMPLGRKLFESKARQMENSRMETSYMDTPYKDDSFSSVPSRILAAATPGNNVLRRSSMANDETSVAYEDEFSEIPDAYLDAATPGRPTLPQAVEDEDDIEDEMIDEIEGETGENRAEAAEEQDEADDDAPRVSSPKSVALSNASVSYTRSDSGRMPTPDDTPSPNDVAIPQSDAKTIEAVDTSPLAEQSQPHGEMSSDPPVPQLTTTLPVAAAATTEPTSSSQPPSAAKSRTSWTQPLSNLIQAGAQFFQSPTRPTAQPAVEQQSGRPYDDPFGHENDHIGQPSFMEALAKSVKTSPAVRNPSVSASMSGSLRVAPPDEADEMSWMEEPPAPREQPFTETRIVDSNAKTPGASMVSRRLSSDGRVQDEADETEVEEQSPAEEEEEEDIWAIEASRPASSSSRQQPFGKQSVTAARHAIPLSPWKRRAQSPKKQTSANLAVTTPAASHYRVVGADEAEVEDFSMMSQQQNRQKRIPQKAFEVAQRSSAKKDLAAFFSSPALLPGAEGVQGILDLKRRQNALPPKDIAEPSGQFGAGLETNSMFPSVPQKAFNPSASGRSDLFSPAKPAATSAAKLPSTVRREIQGTLTFDTSRNSLSSAKSRGNVRHLSEIPDSQPSMSDNVSSPPVAQKKSFTHKTAQRPQQLSNEASAPVPSLTPVRMQLSRADIRKWQEDSASAIAEDSPESERRILRPLPDRNLSPTKSCLRSPLKPRTPGRVVEFTSSVLSPLAQAQARAERRMSASSSGSASQQRNVVVMEEEDKENDVTVDENEDADVSMMDAPETRPSKPAEVVPRLSPTMWSRDHWLLMDDLIQLRRQGPFNFQFPADFQSKSGWLLGRTVNSHGASLVMEQWHLDVVDAFKAEVGGWDEEVLAKRVFSLVVGEELRKQGKAPEAPSVRFA
ncbi:hypothetical protein CCHL11_01458 [Colletotrichum chlorophyti]|uniref:Uncharacterized protein n=1 Tax=Colletotrichum chlorophyti TaxID=708187 RepID=A0A1Q8RYU4_9PEZI|nr:hypothetical protein CCHL11_01458 [Colletotrichum chlorophyti]